MTYTWDNCASNKQKPWAYNQVLCVDLAFCILIYVFNIKYSYAKVLEIE